MQLKKVLEKWDLDSLKISAGFLQMQWVPRDEDKTAAWELYVEMLTRVVTQSLVPGHGSEQATVDSIYQLFPITREIIRRNGRYCINFSKIAIVVLNQIVRPFTTKWHREFAAATSLPEDKVVEFRIELLRLQSKLQKYARLLAELADVEDLVDFEEGQGR